MNNKLERKYLNCRLDGAWGKRVCIRSAWCLVLLFLSACTYWDSNNRSSAIRDYDCHDFMSCVISIQESVTENLNLLFPSKGNSNQYLKGGKNLKYEAKVEISLNVNNGELVGIKLIQKSESEGFNNAVINAVKRSSPFLELYNLDSVDRLKLSQIHFIFVE
ncbi:MAG: TonB C-terminal domain-containing protein [Arenicella sp.]